ncbi:MAG: AIR synthase family protein [Planctomycetota bacterium]
MKYETGKLDPEMLNDLIGNGHTRDERVVVKPGIGKDVCAIEMGDTYLVAKTDPITFATDRIGWYVVQVNANDIATAGARPKWFLVTALLPERRTDERLIESIWDDMNEALDGLDCTLCGGHTEVTVGLDRPILVGQMLGEVSREDLVDKEQTRPGDRILLTKGVPVEGTAIIAREKEDRLGMAFGEEMLKRARDFLENPGISVVTDALTACKAGDVHAMHDPTEGGVATGLWELAQATGLGLRVEAQKIPILQPGGDFCRELGLNPFGTISSGSLLICVSPDSVSTVVQALARVGVKCVEIGKMLEAGDDAVLVREGEDRPMPTYHRDEITKLWEE